MHGVRALDDRVKGPPVRFSEHDVPVPRVSYFYGISIYMYFNDHAPPHFHALYGGDEAQIAIEDGRVLRGELPGRALRFVREWLEDHRHELDENWRRGSRPEPFQRIDPLP